MVEYRVRVGSEVIFSRRRAYWVAEVRAQVVDLAVSCRISLVWAAVAAEEGKSLMMTRVNTTLPSTVPQSRGRKNWTSQEISRRTERSTHSLSLSMAKDNLEGSMDSLNRMSNLICLIPEHRLHYHRGAKTGRKSLFLITEDNNRMEVKRHMDNHLMGANRRMDTMVATVGDAKMGLMFGMFQVN